MKFRNMSFGRSEALFNIIGGEVAIDTILADSNLASQVARCIKDLIENAATYLTPLYEGESISLKATQGSVTIAGAGDLFTAYLSSRFGGSDINRQSKSTRTAKVKVYEQCRNGTFRQFFTSVNTDLDRSCFTQAQIIQFCRDHRDKLRQDGYATFFLFKVGKEYFVASVGVGGASLDAFVVSLGDSNVWNAEGRNRVVMPQLVA